MKNTIRILLATALLVPGIAFAQTANTTSAVQQDKAAIAADNAQIKQERATVHSDKVKRRADRTNKAAVAADKSQIKQDQATLKSERQQRGQAEHQLQVDRKAKKAAERQAGKHGRQNGNAPVNQSGQ